MLSRMNLLAAGLLAPLFISTAFAGEGRTQGQFTVSPQGSAQYSIPIWTPPGIQAIQPQLSLSYNSNSGNGIMGPGWSLGGQSSISRCVGTYAQDGAPFPITLTMADRFCIDGQRLRLTSSENLSTYGSASTTYQTEIADFRNVIASSSLAGNGPASFIVQGKDGLSYEYGASAGSQVFAAQSTTTPMS